MTATGATVGHSGVVETHTARLAGPAGELVVQCWGNPAIEQHGRLPVCFVHPVNTGAAVWAPLAERLASAGRACIAPDLRGHGGSDQRGPFTVDGYAADVLAVLDVLGVERVHLVGGSIGGPVGLALAATTPERIATVAGLGVALALRLPDGALEQTLARLRAEGTRSTFEQLAPGAVAAGADPAIAALVVELATGPAEPRSPDLVGEAMVGAFTTDVTALASRVGVPCLVANGTEDGTCTPADAAAMVGALANCRVAILDGVGHLPMLEAPDRMAALLDDLFPAGEVVPAGPAAKGARS